MSCCLGYHDGILSLLFMLSGIWLFHRKCIWITNYIPKQLRRELKSVKTHGSLGVIFLKPTEYYQDIYHVHQNRSHSAITNSLSYSRQHSSLNIAMNGITYCPSQSPFPPHFSSVISCSPKSYRCNLLSHVSSSLLITSSFFEFLLPINSSY